MDLTEIGFTKEELQEKLVQKMCDQLLKDVYFDEDGNEDEKKSWLHQKMLEKTRAAVEKKLDALFNEHIAPGVDKFVENLTLEESNRWGEKKGIKLTFIEYLIQRADAYMREEVNYEGKAENERNGYSWTKSQTRITHLVHKHLHYSVEQAMKKAIADANKSIVGGLETAVKIKLDEISKNLKVSVEPAR